jgi:hypothetical protein
MIRSPNLRRVISRLENARDRIPTRVQKAIAPEKFVRVFRELAEQAMLGVAVNDTEREAIPSILASVVGSKTDLGSRFDARSTPLQISTVNPNDPFQVEIPTQEVIDWVKNYKDLKQDRDYFKTGPNAGEPYPVEWIASRVMFAIKRDPEPWFGVDKPGQGALNPKGLLAIAGETGLPPASIERLLMAVIHYWAAYAVEKIPAIIGREILATFRD